MVMLTTGPAAASQQAAAAETILTLRMQGDHDTMWLVSNEGTATAAGELPGTAEMVAASPDGSSVAYMPFEGKPFVWIGYGPAAPKTIPLASAGIKTITGLTWISETQLVVSGSAKALSGYGYYDKLYTVDVASGAVAPFRRLSGTDPYAAPSAGKLMYVNFKVVKKGKTQRVTETLMLADINGSGAGRQLDSDVYTLPAAYRAFAAPELAPGGDWFAYGTTGSDVSVRYTIDFVDSETWQPWLTMWMPTPLAIAWAPASPLLALGGSAVGPDDHGSVYIFDVAGGDVGRTSRDLLSKAGIEWIMDMDWSADGHIVADGLTRDDSGPVADVEHALLLDSGDLTTLKDLGEGRFSVWVR